MEYFTFPGLYFYLENNPNYGKTVDNITIENPSEEYYAIYLGDCMTLGRDTVNYEEFCANVIANKIEDFKRSSKCQLVFTKFAANSFQDIIDYYNNNKDKIVKFQDNLLNDYFGLEPLKIGKIDIS